MTETTIRRRGELARGVLTLLVSQPSGVPFATLLDDLRRLVPPTDYEQGIEPTGGAQRYVGIARRSLIAAELIGWLVERRGYSDGHYYPSDGQFFITDDGRRALELHHTPHQLADEIGRLTSRRDWLLDAETGAKRLLVGVCIALFAIGVMLRASFESIVATRIAIGTSFTIPVVMMVSTAYLENRNHHFNLRSLRSSVLFWLAVAYAGLLLVWVGHLMEMELLNDAPFVAAAMIIGAPAIVLGLSVALGTFGFAVLDRGGVFRGLLLIGVAGALIWAVFRGLLVLALMILMFSRSN